MKSLKHRIAFWLLLAVYAGGSFWWLVTVPRNPDQLLRAIPGQAMIVSYHDQLAQRWNSIASHPAVMMLVGATGGDVESWLELQDDPGFLYVLNLAGRDQLALAYVPFLHGDGEGAWVFSSWIGGHSQRLRWSQSFFDIPGLESLGMIGSWPAWTWTMETDTGDQKLTLALVEGMLVGTTARDPQAIHYILEAYDGNFPSIGTRQDLANWNQQLLGSAFPDRGWYKVQNLRREPTYWFGECDLSATNQMRGGVITAAPAPWSTLPESFDLDGLIDFWGDKPIATAAVNSDVLANALSVAPDFVTRLASDVVAQSGAEASVIGLFGGPYSGRLKVIAVPTLMVALQCAPGVEAEALIGKITDDWNARYRMGLVPVEHFIGANKVWRMEGTAGGLYGTLSSGEQIAVTTAGDWLVISSNFAALDAVIRAKGPDAGSGELAWVDRMNEVAGKNGIGYLGFDLERGAEVMHMSIKAYAGKLAFEDFRGTREQRQRLNEARAWIDTLARLNRLQVFASQVNDQLKIDFQTAP
jgi:hypothetical protein